MHEASLCVELEWDRRLPERLYPEGPPARGTPIDTIQHRARFGTDSLVLTTGARSTHALGRAIFIGTAPVTPRTLAHELGHLLGFDDEYLRAFVGKASDPAGVAFVEVGASPDSLMAAPATGKVTVAMVRRLFEDYPLLPPPRANPVRPKE